MFVTAKAQDFITYSRSSIGTYVGSDGLIKTAAVDEARIEYGSAGSLKGLLIEEQRTNLEANSNPAQPNNWGGGGLDYGTQILRTKGPDGVTDSIFKVQENTATGVHYFAQNLTVPVGTNTFSCIVKDAGDGRWVYWRTNNDGVNQWINVNPATGEVTEVGTAVNDYGVVDLGNGFYRLWFSCDSSDGASGWILGSSNTATPGNSIPSFTGTSEAGFYGGFVQVEQGSFATSYIPTSGSTVTRSPDIASIPITAFGHNPSSGTIVVEFDYKFADGEIGYPRPFEYGNQGTSVNRINVFTRSETGDFRFGVMSNNVGPAITIAEDTGSPVSGKAAVAFTDGDTAACFNGGSVVTGSQTVTGPSSPREIIKIGGQAPNANSNISGHIKSLKYYPRKLAGHEISLETYSGTINTTYYVTNSGSGAYAFTGGATGNNPTLDVVRGNTYAFSVNASGHPFYLTTDDGTNFSAGNYVSEYTTGVTNSRSQDNTLFWTVDASAPNTLYYQCGNHAAMKGTINITG